MVKRKKIKESPGKPLAFHKKLCYTKQRLCKEDYFLKEVNESNEERNPSRLSADYDYLRLR